ncbi:MAG: response regulator [Bdellovibrionales bacterium]|nr:response regulator [Bdellovibrionales bacterium]
MRVCLIDAEEDIRLLMSDLFELLDSSCESFASCEEALSAINETDYDLIVSDKRLLNGMSGIACAMKMHEEGNSTPVILMTGEGEQTNEQDPLPENIRLVLSKPFGLDELKEAIEKIMASTPSASGQSEVAQPTPASLKILGSE